MSSPAEWKFRLPPARPGIVPRTALVERVVAARPAAVVCVTAPPGYGKTTFLAQWARRAGPPPAWVSVDRGDNDTVALLTAAASALDRTEPIGPAVFRSLASPAASIAAAGVARISAALTSRTRPFRLVIDHAELLDNPECVDVIAELATRLPDGSQLAVATRSSPPLPTALLRSRRQLIEVGVADLAMNEHEAAALLGGAGVDVSAGEVAELVRRTEGWPAGLYLAALALKTSGRGTALAFTGDHRLMADYLRSEFLSHVDPAMLRFLTRTATPD